MLIMVQQPSHHADAISEVDKRRCEMFVMQDDEKGGFLVPKNS